MKRGDVYLAEIKEYRSEGLLVKIGDTELLLPAAEIKGGIKPKHKKMIGWFIPVRVQSIRPLAISNLRIDKKKMSALGLRDATPIEKVSGASASASASAVPTGEKTSAQRRAIPTEEPQKRKMELICEPLLNGIMAYWDKIENAAIYYVHLLIEEKKQVTKVVAGRATSIKSDKTICREIATIEVPRNMTYYSFLNLAKIDSRRQVNCSGYHCNDGQVEKNYYLYVEAEDRSGKIIFQTDRVLGQVYIIVDGYYSLTN